MRTAEFMLLCVCFLDENEKTSSHNWERESLSTVISRAVDNDMIAAQVTHQYQIVIDDTNNTEEQ